jgi:hypothetical protein
MAIDYNNSLKLNLFIMTKSSIKKLSILGLVLIAASAVTAAITPKEKATKTDGVFKGEGSVSCIPGGGADCQYTIGSNSSEGAATSADNSASSSEAAGRNTTDAPDA